MPIVETLNRWTPQEAGFRPEALAALDEHFRKLIADRRMQCGSYLLAREGRIFAEAAFGSRTFRAGSASGSESVAVAESSSGTDSSPAADLEAAPRSRLGPASEDDLLRTDSIRRIASITKLFVAVGIFQLIEQGKLNLRQPVSHWIEEFKHPKYAGIRIWHLLTHTSGIWPDPGYYTEPYPFGSWDVRFAFEPDTEGPFAVKDEEEALRLRKSAWIRAMLSGSPGGEPGREWRYSSIGYSVLGEIISRASGMPFETYILRHITEPLGMSRTFFEVPEALHGEVCVTNDWDERRLTDLRDRTFDPPRAGGGLHSTLGDLFKFGQMLLDNGVYGGTRILSRKSVERMTRDHLAGQDVFGFCWGGRVPAMKHGLGPGLTGDDEWYSPGSYGHEGAGRSKLLIDPIRRAVVVYFVPSNLDWVPESLLMTNNLIGAGWQ
ncbi:serine hydrolase [Cohnella sp. REN36]|uniref:serine hydrolase domain-containing protein n=1 Tax=Cohnella sp. REN36 TaxID=2887347 RepID=UPI001D1448E4|nr:serine hydrolase domain-containing protein [Cohnella sp. REN36]MCC3377473.1 beta-lactamase family protein [Cohnella sp. REN36]